VQIDIGVVSALITLYNRNENNYDDVWMENIIERNRILTETLVLWKMGIKSKCRAIWTKGKSIPLAWLPKPSVVSAPVSQWIRNPAWPKASTIDSQLLNFVNEELDVDKDVMSIFWVPVINASIAQDRALIASW